mgnify:CR=1|tara:strand:+ start:1088 stop:1294 length:207 start_codon:yes stop_codon:yes gene_type:complete
MNTEYIVWGIKPHETEEEILFTKATTLQEARKVSEILEERHKCTATRIQIIDFTACASKAWTNPNLIN